MPGGGWVGGVGGWGGGWRLGVGCGEAEWRGEVRGFGRGLKYFVHRTDELVDSDVVADAPVPVLSLPMDKTIIRTGSRADRLLACQVI
jgi:hypothetical protein